MNILIISPACYNNTTHKNWNLIHKDQFIKDVYSNKFENYL